MDTDLVTRAQRGDKGAYALIAASVADRFLAVARRILRDRDLAEDATQQALLAMWQDLPRLNDPARFEAWSYRLLVHACYAEGRKERLFESRWSRPPSSWWRSSACDSCPRSPSVPATRASRRPRTRRQLLPRPRRRTFR